MATPTTAVPDSGPATISLPPELTIYTATELHQAWLTALAAPQTDGDWAVDADAVDEVDAAGLQMLVALRHSLAARQQRLVLRQPSGTLERACRLLGCADLLRPQPGPDSASPGSDPHTPHPEALA